jgi:lipopolysaccharide transport system permease protein
MTVKERMADSGKRSTYSSSVVVIRPQPEGALSRLGELVASRETLFFLAWRDIRVRYKQTAIGVTWAVLQPVLTMFAFSLFFGRLARMPSDGLPYPLFVLCGLVPWQLFAYSLTNGANSLVANEQLVTKVYFPRLILPLAVILVGLIDFMVGLVLLLVAMALFGIAPSVHVLALPVFVLMAVGAAAAIGIGCRVNVRYRRAAHRALFTQPGSL